jgi:hypothetical protein
MKKLFITIFILLLFTPLYSADNIVIKQGDYVIGEFTPNQFDVLIQGANSYKEIMLAQKQKRVYITTDEIYPTDNKGEYKTVMTIRWKDKNGYELNYITSELILNIDNDASGKIKEWRIIYRDISEYGFPITGGFLLLLILLL